MRSAVFWVDGSPQQNNFLGDILSKSKRVVVVGGYWDYGTDGGVFYSGAHGSRGDSWHYTGFRLARAQDIFVRMIKVRTQIMSIRSMPPCFLKQKKTPETESLQPTAAICRWQAVYFIFLTKVFYYESYQKNCILGKSFAGI